MKDKPQLYITQNAPQPDAAEIVRNGLKRFNSLYTSQIVAERSLEADINPLELFLLDQAGTTQGGLLAYTHWGWLHVQALWLAEEHRGFGYGHALLEEVEQKARQRNCLYSRLATYSFQALAFYQKHGYEIWGQLADYPPGFVSYALKKAL